MLAEHLDYKRWFSAQVQKGLDCLAEGRTLTHEEVEARAAKPRDVYQPIRVALAGTTVSPGIFETPLLRYKEHGTTIALAHMIFEGVFDRAPGLKVIAAHGGGFLAHYADRFDHGCRLNPAACDSSITPWKTTDLFLDV